MYVPVVPEILRSKVAVLVELHRSARELQRLNAALEQANARARAGQHEAAGREDRASSRRSTGRSQQANARAATQTNRALQSEIAERARAEQALKEADRHKDEFLAMLAHELRNPLAPIRNAVADHAAEPVGRPAAVVVVRAT